MTCTKEKIANTSFVETAVHNSGKRINWSNKKFMLSGTQFFTVFLLLFSDCTTNPNAEQYVATLASNAIRNLWRKTHWMRTWWFTRVKRNICVVFVEMPIWVGANWRSMNVVTLAKNLINAIFVKSRLRIAKAWLRIRQFILESSRSCVNVAEISSRVLGTFWNTAEQGPIHVDCHSIRQT